MPIAMSNSVHSASLDNERFVEAIDLVRRRMTDPDARTAIDADPLLSSALARYQDAIDTCVQRMNQRMCLFRAEDFKKQPFTPYSLGQRSAFPRLYWAQTDALFSPELAVVLGELARVAAMSDEELDRLQLAREPLLDSIREGLGAERRIESLYPLLAVTSDVFLRHNRRNVEPGEGGLPLDVVIDAIRNLDRINKALGISKERPIAYMNIGRRLMGELGRQLATPKMMDIENLAAVYQVCYDEHWHTNPKGKTPSGGFVEELREWTRRQGKPELLVVLAASSDGRNRAVAGASERTPLSVYDKMIYDNALMVLNEVVQNPRFNDERAYAMIKSNGAPQLTSVMLHGRVDLSIRALACEKAIRHPGVNPYFIYVFLASHARKPDIVPHGYWSDFVKELNTRLATIRVHGDEQQADLFERRLKRFTSAFVQEVLKPYAEAHKQIVKLERLGTPLPNSRRDQELEAAREFVRAHEFVKDPELLDIILETETDSKTLIEILTYCLEANIPVTDKCLVRVFQHEERSVRETGMRLLPNVRPEDVERASAELQERIRRDCDAVRDRVLTDIIPDFEDIEGVLRRRSANHHYFEAADEIPLDELVQIFERCYKKDPTTIPEEFYQVTTLRRHAMRYRAQEESPSRERSWPTGDSTKPMVQGDLFGDIGFPAPLGMVSREARKSSARAL